tara:strand:- start:18 stop:428 length:411 start_codon:yes stop_codon:yes gene_type:complete
MSSMKLNNFQSESLNIITISSDTVLTRHHCGSIIFCDASSAININLPPPEHGLHLTFIVKDHTAHTTIYSQTNNFDSSGSSLIYIINSNISTDSLQNKFIIKSDAAKKGDKIELICDGEYWYASCTLHSSTAVASS